MALTRPLPAARAGDRAATFGSVLLLGGLTIYLLLPLLAVLLYSLATRWTARVLPDGYTLEHWQAAFADPRLVAAFGRSLALAAAVVLLDALLVLPASYWARVRNSGIRPFVELAAVIPFSLPFVVIAFGVLQVAGQLAPILQGTVWLLLLAHAAVAFPFFYWAVDGAMAAAQVERLSEAAETCGAGPLQIIWQVVLPNIATGIATGSILVLSVSFGEFALAQILIGAAFETVPLWSADALGRSAEGRFNELAVVTVLTFVLQFLLSAGLVYGNRGQAVRLLPGARPVERR